MLLGGFVRWIKGSFSCTITGNDTRLDFSKWQYLFGSPGRSFLQVCDFTCTISPKQNIVFQLGSCYSIFSRWFFLFLFFSFLKISTSSPELHCLPTDCTGHQYFLDGFLYIFAFSKAILNIDLCLVKTLLLASF
jgi:hypothetical protein